MLVEQGFLRCTPVGYTPVGCTPIYGIHAYNIQAYEMYIRSTPMRCGLMRHRHIGCTLMRCISIKIFSEGAGSTEKGWRGGRATTNPKSIGGKGGRSSPSRSIVINKYQK